MIDQFTISPGTRHPPILSPHNYISTLSESIRQLTNTNGTLTINEDPDQGLTDLTYKWRDRAGYIQYENFSMGTSPSQQYMEYWLNLINLLAHRILKRPR